MDGDQLAAAQVERGDADIAGAGVRERRQAGLEEAEAFGRLGERPRRREGEQPQQDPKQPLHAAPVPV